MIVPADVNFCRIIGNKDNQSIYIYNTDGGTVNATNNWWGSNNSPSGEVSGNVDVSTWLVLNINASPTDISPNGNSIITADLTHDQNGTYYDPTLGHVPDGIPVSFTSTLGTLNPTSTTTLNGNGASIYTAGTITGSGSVKVIVDNQIVNTQININNPQADVALSQTGNYSGSSVTFIVTATNNGPDNATYINIKDLIPVGLTGATVSPSVGSYNSTTGIWTINSLLERHICYFKYNWNCNTTKVQYITIATKINQTEYDPTS